LTNTEADALAAEHAMTEAAEQEIEALKGAYEDDFEESVGAWNNRKLTIKIRPNFSIGSEARTANFFVVLVCKLPFKRVLLFTWNNFLGSDMSCRIPQPACSFQVRWLGGLQN